MPYIKPGTPEWEARNELLRQRDAALKQQAPMPSTPHYDPPVPLPKPPKVPSWLRSPNLKQNAWRSYVLSVEAGDHVPARLRDYPSLWPKLVTDTVPANVYSRFLSNIDVKPEIGSNCWLWVPPNGTATQPNFGVQAHVTVTAHSFAYSIWVAPLLEEDRIGHTCAIKVGCVFPKHLIGRRGTRS